MVAVLNGNGFLKVLSRGKKVWRAIRARYIASIAAFTQLRFLKKHRGGIIWSLRWFVGGVYGRIIRSMDLNNDQNQDSGVPEQDNFWTARFVKFLGVFLAIIGLVSGGYWIWFNYYSATAKMQANYEKYEDWQAAYDKAMREDIYGGKTPQETLSMFIDALKKGDIDLASKYFALDENLSRDEWKTALENANTEGMLGKIVDALSVARIDPGAAINEDYAVFTARDQNGAVLIDMNLRLNKNSGTWKIEGL